MDLLKGLLRVGSPKATVDLILEQLLDLDQGPRRDGTWTCRQYGIRRKTTLSMRN